MKIIFIGPLPPPVHGFSAINFAMHNLLKDRNIELITFNRTPPISKYAFIRLAGKLVHVFMQVLSVSMLLIKSKPRSVYVGLSGGLGQLFDLPFLLLTHLFGVKVFIHHHSYAYINSPTGISKAVFYLTKNARHIALCESMKISLQEVYGLDEKNVLALSNSAFDVDTNLVSEKSERVLTLGFISNITADKGIFEFFDLIELLNKQNCKVCGRIAGPVNKDIQGEFNRRISSLNNVIHLGPVYGQSKQDFYSNIDILSFPTKYVNEAEPVTIIEALKNGIPVVAALRGCIADQIDSRCGLVIGNYENIVKDSAIYVQKILTDSSFFAEQKAGARLKFNQLHSVNYKKLELLINEITHGSK